MKIIALATTFLFACSLLSGAETILPWSAGLNRPERFEKNCSGAMTIRRDTRENAIRFDVKFSRNSDYWCYPRLRLHSHETLAGATAIRFEFRAVQKDPAAGYLHALVMFENGMPYFPLPPPKPEYQQVTIPLARAVKNPAAVRQLRIGMNPRSEELTFYLRNIEVIGKPTGPAPCDVAEVVTAEAPGAAFLQGEPVRFTLKSSVRLLPEWTLKNWKGEVLRSGSWPGKRELLLESLPNGYYTLELSSPQQPFQGFRSFAIVADPSVQPRNPEMFFALDSAQSWLARPNPANSRHPGDGYAIVSEVARRAGLKTVRDRLSWGECEPAPGKFNWRQYMTNATLLSERGIQLSGMYHDAPKWAKTNTTHLPGDLVATYRFAKKLAETFRGKMAVWEFWNEQDIGFAPEGAWDYASALKAAYLGFKAGDPDLPVAIGAFAHTHLPPYADVVMENGVERYFDIFNIHTYARLCECPELLANLHRFLKQHKVEDRPIWFTENGCYMEGVGKTDSYMAGLKAHSPEQEMIIAEFLPKMMVTMQSLGVDRDFIFVLSPYNERNGFKDWGLMRRDYTVKPAFAVFATLTDKLGNATLLGSRELGPGLRGFVYRQPDGSGTLVYWSLSEIDTEKGIPAVNLKDSKAKKFSLPLEGKFTGVDAFGTPFTVQSANHRLELTATRMPSILTGLPAQEPTTPREIRPRKMAESGEYDRTIVFRTELSDDFKLLGDKSGVDIKREDAAFRLQVFNLSDETKSGKVAIAGGKVSGLPGTVTIPPFGKIELPLKITPDLNEDLRGEIRITGTFNGKPATRSVIPCCMLPRMSRKVVMPDMEDPGSWRVNSSGAMTITFDHKEKALRFQAKFSPGVDCWVYPEYLLQLPQESLKGALGLSFEVKAHPAAQVKQMLVMAVMGTQKEEGESVYLSVPNPTEQWEERFVLFANQFDPDKVQQLRIGVNTNAAEITYLIRNIKVLYAR